MEKYMQLESGDIGSKEEWFSDFQSMDRESWGYPEGSNNTPTEENYPDWLEVGHLVKVEYVGCGPCGTSYPVGHPFAPKDGGVCFSCSAENNTDLDYAICEWLDICIDEFDELPLDQVIDLREYIS